VRTHRGADVGDDDGVLDRYRLDERLKRCDVMAGAVNQRESSKGACDAATLATALRAFARVRWRPASGHERRRLFTRA